MQVRKIDFAKLDRLTTRADAELRETEGVPLRAAP